MTTKVVYIAGAGRSGSTFLSQLLSQNPDCMNVGQIRHLAMSYGRKRLCSCGKALPDCTYWGKVAAGLVEKYGPQAIDALKTGFDNFQHASDAFENWGDSAARAALATQQAGFLTMLGDLYQLSGEVAGTLVLIDSSKLPNVALALLLCQDISLFTLNLVRDPRGVYCSWAKLVNEPDGLRNRARNWNKRVDRMAELESVPGHAFLRVRYEDFAASPQPALARIQRWAGLAEGTAFFTSDSAADLTWERTHLFPPANEEVLLKKATHIEIRTSESWKSGANSAHSAVAERINFPKATEVGYLKDWAR